MAGTPSPSCSDRQMARAIFSPFVAMLDRHDLRHRSKVGFELLPLEYSRYRFIDGVANLRWLQIILWHILWDLSLLCPLSDRLKILTFVLRIEVNKRLRIFSIPPDLPKESSIRCAHQLLSDDIQAMRNVILYDIVLVDERALALGAVVVDIVVQRLADKVQAVKMVKTLDVGGESTSVLGVDLHLIWLQSRL